MLTLLLLATLAQAQTIQLLPPDKAKPDDLKKAAEAMEARCKAFGYKDVTAKVGKAKTGPTVELACKEGFTAAMTERIRGGLSKYPITKHEIVLIYPMSQAEEDRFPRPEDPKDFAKAKCPTGAAWTLVHHIENPTANKWTYPVVSGFRLGAGDFTIAHQPGDVSFITITLTDAAAQKWKALPEPLKRGNALSMYNGGPTFGEYSGGFNEKAGKVSAYVLAQEHELMAVLYPLPIPLK